MKVRTFRRTAAAATAALALAGLGFGATGAGPLAGAAAFALSQLDEDFQAEQWGVDAEAAQTRARLASDAGMIDRWFQALRRTDLS